MVNERPFINRISVSYTGKPFNLSRSALRNMRLRRKTRQRRAVKVAAAVAAAAAAAAARAQTKVRRK